jgi:hypothetical protein
MAGFAAKLRTAVILLLVLGGLLADWHCDSLELLLLKVTLQGNLIKISFVKSRIIQFVVHQELLVCPSQWPRGLRRRVAPPACWDCGFESRREHVCLSVVCVVLGQLDFFAVSWSVVQGSPTDCSASFFVI